MFICVKHIDVRKEDLPQSDAYIRADEIAIINHGTILLNAQEREGMGRHFIPREKIITNILMKNGATIPVADPIDHVMVRVDNVLKAAGMSVEKRD
jgi:hypothetical protein